ncbi:hypothetical protein TRFO_38660 [Tritrichomonas foetus]|uniref:Nucleoplasmin-like domain-containing protein n=1 Tax=Tritrichomonas foetus TaxID=1144522 RepID=A0A1J4J8U5_9EUKA|nr:hypothetical protein TRFO_38660 [Tritrichomonas foetus]|eukprot:OHS95113.1 hypothetical protein TRFO_38660 [Tritrichomonas foetus]
MEGNIPQSFWGVVVSPGTKLTLSPPEDVYTLITSACLGEFDENNPSSTSKLTGTIHTTNINEIDPTKDFDPEEITQTTFAFLTPGKCEQVKLNHIFSPLSRIELEVDGAHPVFVAGKYAPVDSHDEEEDIPEEEEDLNDEELMAKLKEKYVKKPKKTDEE